MIHVLEDNCIGCNACIRTCPVPNANRYDGRIVKVSPSECIQCGECVKGCRHHARYYDDDLDTLMELIKTKKVSLIVAPAIKTALDGKWRHVLKWLKDMGVHEVYDGAFGADICTYMHIRYVKEHPGEKIISQPCAAIVNYAEKHKPELLPEMLRKTKLSEMICLFLIKKLSIFTVVLMISANLFHRLASALMNTKRFLIKSRASLNRQIFLQLTLPLRLQEQVNLVKVLL